MITVKRMNKIDRPDVKAFFDVNINGVDIYGVKLVTSKKDNSLFVAFPTERSKNNEYFNVVYIEDMALRDELKDTLMAIYTKKE